MPIFMLKPKASIDPEGHRVEILHRIGRMTEKAVLLEVVRLVEDMETRSAAYWFPKSQIDKDDKKIEIPEWLWDKKVPV